MLLNFHIENKTHLATRNPVAFSILRLCFHLPYEAYTTQLYIVYYFFNFYFIYIRDAYTHTHAKGESEKVAGCGLRFLHPPESATSAFCNRNLATFGNGRFGKVRHGVLRSSTEALRLLKGALATKTWVGRSEKSRLHQRTSYRDPSLHSVPFWMTEKREKSFVANAPLDDKEEWTKN